jgi:hypothetical protein
VELPKQTAKAVLRGVQSQGNDTPTRHSHPDIERGRRSTSCRATESDEPARCILTEQASGDRERGRRLNKKKGANRHCPTRPEPPTRAELDLVEPNNNDGSTSPIRIRAELPRTALGPPAGSRLSRSQATSNSWFRRCSTSHFGGRPRRGCSAHQSMGCSTRTVRVVSSVAAVLPPHVPQRRRHQATSRLAEGESAGWNKIGALGGHWFDRAVPASRAHKRHVISATKIR